MKNILSFDDENITYLKARAGRKITVKKIVSEKLEKGIMNGGIINYDDSLAAILLKFSEKNIPKKAKVHIVINSSIFYREMTIPFAGQKILREIIKNEIIGTMGNYDDYIMDYAILDIDRKKNTCNILAFVIYRKVLKSYLDVAKKSGINVESVNIASNTASKFLGFINPKEKIFAVVMVFKNGIDLYLIENSYGILFRSIKLSMNKFKENNAINVAYEEISEHVNQIIQFHKGRNKTDELKTIYVSANFNEAEELMEVISADTGLSCLKLDAGKFIKSRTEFSAEYNIAAIGAVLERK